VPARTGADLTWWRIAAAWILIVAALSRLYALDLKPLHHDEGVNGFFLINLITSRAGYRYDPSNYHGPALYYLARVSTAVFGVSTFAIRFVPAIFGLLTIVLLLSLRKRIGAIGSLVAAALVALSPGAVYMSRYFIHEALLVFFTLGAVVALAQYADSKRSRDLIWAAAALGFMFATKETAIIALATGIIAFGATMVVGKEPGEPPSLEAPGSIATGSTHPVIAVTAAAAVFVGINVLFFSSFFQHPEAVPDAVRAFLPWARTGTAVHVHPWWTYFVWMAQEEGLILGVGALGIAAIAIRRNDRFALFSALWAVGMLIAYSIVPYKTPWLTLNLIPPLAVVAGYGIDQAWRRSRQVMRGLIVAGGCVLAIVTTTQMVRLNFLRYDDPAYPYVYAHTQRDLLRLVRDIDAIAGARAPQSGRLHVTVTSPQQFPLSWYLRNYDVGYYDHVVTTDDPVVVGAVQQDMELVATLGESYERHADYALRPGVRLVMYVRR